MSDDSNLQLDTLLLREVTGESPPVKLAPALVASVIDQRLSGAQLEAPYDPSRGEQPEDIFVDWFGVDTTLPEHREAYENAMLLLAEKKAHPSIHSLDLSAVSLDAEVRLWLQRFLRLVTTTRPKGFERLLSSWLSFLAPGEDKSREIRALFLSVLEAYLSQATDRRPIAALATYALEDPGVQQDVAALFGTYDPKLFGSSLLAHYLSHVMDGLMTCRDDQQDSRLEQLADTLRVVLDGAKSKPEVIPHLSASLRGAIPIITSKKALALPVRNAVLKAAALSEYPARKALDWDDKFWSSQKVQQPDIRLWRPLRDSLREQYGTQFETPANGHTIKLNRIPYTEHAFLLLFQAVVRLGRGIDIEFVDCGWTAKGLRFALRKGRIQMAVHNQLLSDYFKPGELSGPDWPIFTYSGYDLWMTASRLRKVLRGEHAGPTRELAAMLLSGGECPNDAPREAIAALLLGATITAPASSDLFEAAKAYCLSLGLEINSEVSIAEEQSVGDCLPRFLDEEVDAFCGGGNDSAFLSRFFDQRTKRLATIDTSTMDYFYTTTEFLDSSDNSQLLEDLWELWDFTVQVWNDYITTPRIDDLVLALRQYVIVEVNRVTPGGNLSDFQDLQRVIERHDELHTRPLNGVG